MITQRASVEISAENVYNSVLVTLPAGPCAIRLIDALMPVPLSI